MRQTTRTWSRCTAEGLAEPISLVMSAGACSSSAVHRRRPTGMGSYEPDGALGAAGRFGGRRKDEFQRHGVVGMDDEYMKVEHGAAELLRRARRERGLTQVDVADEMAQRGFRWTQPTVARVENGRRHLSLAESHALMDVLGLNEGNAYRRVEPI